METTNMPAHQLKTNRSLLVTIILSIVTLGIYQLVVMSEVSTSINLIASRHDGKKTMHYMLAFLLAILTFGIFIFVWEYGITKRISNELERRGSPVRFTTGDFWAWAVFGLLLFGIGQFVFLYKMFRAMNALSADYNVKG